MEVGEIWSYPYNDEKIKILKIHNFTKIFEPEKNIMIMSRLIEYEVVGKKKDGKVEILPEYNFVTIFVSPNLIPKYVKIGELWVTKKERTMLKKDIDEYCKGYIVVKVRDINKHGNIIFDKKSYINQREIEFGEKYKIEEHIEDFANNFTEKEFIGKFKPFIVA